MVQKRQQVRAEWPQELRHYDGNRKVAVQIPLGTQLGLETPHYEVASDFRVEIRKTQ